MKSHIQPLCVLKALQPKVVKAGRWQRLGRTEVAISPARIAGMYFGIKDDRLEAGVKVKTRRKQTHGWLGGLAWKIV